MKEGKQSYTALFAPTQLANLQVKNRFVRSATYECMATEAGEVTDGILEMYRRLARGDVGLIISGYLYVHPLGRAAKYQLGIHDDKMIPGLRKLVDSVHQEGVTPPLATKYAKWLAELGIDGLELSCGTIYSPWNIVRGEVPVRETVKGFAWWKKPLVRLVLNRQVGKYNLQEGYNLEAAQMIKPAVGKLPIFLVGGLRRVDHMEEILERGYTDFISMCRPFIREPFLVKRIKEGKTSVASCVSCNKCFGAAANNMAVRCYSKDLPKERD